MRILLYLLKSGIVFEKAEKYILLIDSIMYLLSGNISRHTNIIIEDFEKNSYIYNDKEENIQSKGRRKFFNIIEEKELNMIFINLLRNMIQMYDKAKNAIFPFIKYDIKPFFEIKFLEYYKTLEYIKLKESEKINKMKNKQFLLDILNKDEKLKDEFFGNQESTEIEEEIRGLRNYYTHTGYYIDNDEIPIPTNNPKRYKKVDDKWLYKVLKYIITVTEIELYNLCGINLIRVDDTKRKLKLIIKEDD